jgi:hypothetical protein
VPPLTSVDATALPVKVGAETEPAGVPPLVDELVAELPVNVGAAIVPAGVIRSLPPVVPTSLCAASVPRRVTPSSAVTSV